MVVGFRLQAKLVGSPREERSASESLGIYLCNRLDPVQFSYQKIYLYNHFSKKEETEKRIQRILRLDLISLATPLYVDPLPAPVIKVLEGIYQQTEKSVEKWSEK